MKRFEIKTKKMDINKNLKTNLELKDIFQNTDRLKVLPIHNQNRYQILTSTLIRTQKYMKHIAMYLKCIRKFHKHYLD